MASALAFEVLVEDVLVSTAKLVKWLHSYQEWMRKGLANTNEALRK